MQHVKQHFVIKVDRRAQNSTDNSGREPPILIRNFDAQLNPDTETPETLTVLSVSVATKIEVFNKKSL